MQIVNASVLSPRSLMPRDEQRRYYALLCGLPSDMIPERCGLWEPLRTPFVRDPIDHSLLGWHSSFFVTRRKPRVDIDAGPAWGGIAPIHASIAVRAESGKRIFPEVLEIAFKAAVEFQADLAFVHVVAPEEYEPGRAAHIVSEYSRSGKRHIIVTTHELRKSLPDLYWFTLFGPPYVALFGEQRLLSAPAPFILKLDYGAISIQLSESPYDFIDDYERMDAIRRRVKEHLDCNAFFDPELPRSHKYNVPTFHLDSERYRTYPDSPP